MSGEWRRVGQAFIFVTASYRRTICRRGAILTNAGTAGTLLPLNSKAAIKANMRETEIALERKSL